MRLRAIGRSRSGSMRFVTPSRQAGASDAGTAQAGRTPWSVPWPGGRPPLLSCHNGDDQPARTAQPAGRAAGAAVAGHRWSGTGHRRNHPGASSRPKPSPWWPAPAGHGPFVQRAGGRHFTLPLLSRDPVTIWRNAARLEALIRAENVTLVHARSRAPAWAAWLACRRTGTHFVTTYHGVYGEDLPFKRHYNAIMAQGEIVIAASHYVADLIQRRHKLDPARIRVIPRGVDPVVFDPDADFRRSRSPGWRKPCACPDGMLTVVMPGAADRVERPGGAVAGDRPLVAPGCVLRARRLRSGTHEIHRGNWKSSANPWDRRPRPHRRPGRGHARRADAVRRRRARLDPTRGVRPRGHRGAGDGPAGDREQSGRAE